MLDTALSVLYNNAGGFIPAIIQIEHDGGKNMKKIIALLLAAIMVLGLAACASKTETKEASDVKNVVYIVNGNLGDKSFFDSARGRSRRSWSRLTAASTLQDHRDGRHRRRSARRGCPRCTTSPKSGELRPRYLRHLPDARLPEGSCHAVSRPAVRRSSTTPPMSAKTQNVVNLSYRQNDMGYLIGVVCRMHDRGHQRCQHQRGCSRRLCRRR